MADGAGLWGAWGQAWGVESSWSGGSCWWEDPASSWKKSPWAVQQPQEEPAVAGAAWSPSFGEDHTKPPAEREGWMSKKDLPLSSVAAVSSEELADERRRTEAESALAEERLCRERAETELTELRRRVEDLEQRLAAAQASLSEAAGGRANAEEKATEAERARAAAEAKAEKAAAETAVAQAAADAATSEVEKLRAIVEERASQAASMIASAEEITAEASSSELSRSQELPQVQDERYRKWLQKQDERNRQLDESSGRTPEVPELNVDGQRQEQEHWRQTHGDPWAQTVPEYGASWASGWSGSAWSSAPRDSSWHSWGGSWSSNAGPNAAPGLERREAVDEQREEAPQEDTTANSLHEEAEPESEIAPAAPQEEYGHVQESDLSEHHANAKEHENTSPAIARQDDGRKGYENEEWYQKWLRRQEHRPRKIIYIGGDQHQEQEAQAEEPQAQPDGNQASTAESSAETSAPPEDDRKSYENEEWYQKWLRRQKNKPRQVIDIGGDAPQDRGGDQEQQQQDQQAPQEGEGEAAASQPEEPGKRGYENEEWYQKWLRRQKNKGRQIIEIGVDKPQEEEKPEEPEDPSVEKRLDPEDGKTYSMAGLFKRYKGHFSDDEIKAYWESDCKVLEADQSTVENASGGGSQAAAAPAESSLEADEAKPAEPEKKPYEQEEWYQKWLRRQANKDRKIIEIG